VTYPKLNILTAVEVYGNLYRARDFLLLL